MARPSQPFNIDFSLNEEDPAILDQDQEVEVESPKSSGIHC